MDVTSLQLIPLRTTGTAECGFPDPSGPECVLFSSLTPLEALTESGSSGESVEYPGTETAQYLLQVTPPQETLEKASISMSPFTAQGAAETLGIPSQKEHLRL